MKSYTVLSRTRHNTTQQTTTQHSDANKEISRICFVHRLVIDIVSHLAIQFPNI